jgi:hypothetical protein
VASGLVGSWHRAQSCKELRSAFERIGLAQSHAENLADLCKTAGPVEHSHFFTASGGFGSHDENGQQVDDGDYRVVDANTVSFPSHAQEFGYSGDILVDYAVANDVVNFTIQLPKPCEASCQDAYAWAASAFSSGPWMRGEAP